MSRASTTVEPVTKQATRRNGAADGSEPFHRRQLRAGLVRPGVPACSGLECLRQWCEILRGCEIATGFFEIGSLLDLDGHWQQIDKIRNGYLGQHPFRYGGPGP